MLRRHAASPAALLLALPLAAVLAGAFAARAGADLVLTVKGHTDAFKVGDREQFQQFVAKNQLKSSIKPSTETRKVRNWTAHRVDVELSNAQGLRVSTQMWLTKDLDLYAAYNKMSGVLASLQVSSADWSSKIGGLDGFPVYQETTVSVGGAAFKSHEEVVQAESKQLLDVTFDPPAGFNPVPYDPFRAPQ